MSATPMSGQLGVMKCRMVDSLACGTTFPQRFSSKQGGSKKKKKESLTCQSKKSLSRDTPEVRMRMSSGGDADVYKFREMSASDISL